MAWPRNSPCVENVISRRWGVKLFSARKGLFEGFEARDWHERLLLWRITFDKTFQNFMRLLSGKRQPRRNAEHARMFTLHQLIIRNLQALRDTEQIQEVEKFVPPVTPQQTLRVQDSLCIRCQSGIQASGGIAETWVRLGFVAAFSRNEWLYVSS